MVWCGVVEANNSKGRGRNAAPPHYLSPQLPGGREAEVIHPGFPSFLYLRKRDASCLPTCRARCSSVYFPFVTGPGLSEAIGSHSTSRRSHHHLGGGRVAAYTIFTSSSGFFFFSFLLVLELGENACRRKSLAHTHTHVIQTQNIRGQ